MTGVSGSDETLSVAERTDMLVAPARRHGDVLDAAITDDLRHLLNNGLRTPRQSAIAALQAARALLCHLGESRLPPGAQESLTEMLVSLTNIEGELADLERHKPPGPILSASARRRSDKDRGMEQQARAVVAVKWLQQLEGHPMRLGQAMKIVAREVCGSESEINAWLAYFSRHNTPRRHDAIYQLWHQVEAACLQAGGRPETATPDMVVQWLNGAPRDPQLFAPQPDSALPVKPQ